MVFLKDLNYDFSEFYFNVDDEICIQKEGSTLFTKPFYNDNKIMYLDCVFEDNLNDVVKRFVAPVMNPHGIIKKYLNKSLNDNRFKQLKFNSIKNLLLEQGVDNDKANLIANEFLKGINNIFKYFPDFKSDKFPHDVDKFGFAVFFAKKFNLGNDVDVSLDSEMIKFFLDYSFEMFLEFYSFKELSGSELEVYENILEPISKLCVGDMEFCSKESSAKMVEFLNSLSVLDYLQLKSLFDFDFWDVNDELSPIMYKLDDDAYELYIDTIFKEYSVGELPSIKKDIEDIMDADIMPLNLRYQYAYEEDKYDFLFYVYETMDKELDYPYFECDGDNMIIDNAIKSGDVIELNYSLLKETNSMKRLKKVIKKHGLKAKGDRSKLIKFIQDNLTQDEISKEFPGQMYMLSEECKNEFDKKQDVFKFKNVLPPQFSLDTFLEICLLNPNYTPLEIVECIIKEDWIISKNSAFDDLAIDVINDEKLAFQKNIDAVLNFDNIKLDNMFFKNNLFLYWIKYRPHNNYQNLFIKYAYKFYRLYRL